MSNGQTLNIISGNVRVDFKVSKNRRDQNISEMLNFSTLYTNL